MHPRVFLDTFWRNDIRDEVFVAMSFEPQFTDRWEYIFKPAIEACPIGGKKLKAIRVDIRNSGDSILSEITDGIAHSQFVLADVSATDTWFVNGKKCHARNGNVMYEVGLAIACRQPVEVLLLRDDDKIPLLFDVSHIPVLNFDPGNIDGSSKQIRSTLEDRMRERDLIKDMRFTSTLESLSQFEINLIRENAHLNLLGWRDRSLPASVAIALPRVLEKKILRLQSPAKDNCPDAYTWTDFGRVIADHLTSI